VGRDGPYATTERGVFLIVRPGRGESLAERRKPDHRIHVNGIGGGRGVPKEDLNPPYVKPTDWEGGALQPFLIRVVERKGREVGENKSLASRKKIAS